MIQLICLFKVIDLGAGVICPRKGYWAPRTIKRPESSGEWMHAESLGDAVLELNSHFDSEVMMEASKNSVYISEANAPMIFFRYLPLEIDALKTPF